MPTTLENTARRRQSADGASLRYLYMIVLVAAVGGFLFGDDLSLIFGVCLACALFVWLAIPETKDKTLEEIGEFWLREDGK